MVVLFSKQNNNHIIKNTIKVDADKSISHRAVILASLAEGKSTISNLLLAKDVMNTIVAFQNLGVDIFCKEDIYYINSSGFNSFEVIKQVFDMGNSGTSCRLITGVLAGLPNGNSTIQGDSSLNKRPMARIIKPLTQMGAKITAQNNQQDSCLPLYIKGNKLQGIDYTMEVASAQVKSCILFAGLHADTETRIVESTATRDHSENMLSNLGVQIVKHQVKENAVEIILKPNKIPLNPYNYKISGDFSSASFFIALALINEDAELSIRDVNLNPTRTGLLQVLEEMGANITLSNIHKVQGELCGDILVKSSKLKGVEVNPTYVASMIDEFPILAVIAAFAEGKTVFSQVQELKTKESDRIQSIYRNLIKLGIRVSSEDNKLIIEGNPSFNGGGIEVESFHDHRIAMSFLIFGSRCKIPIKVLNCENIGTSFPNFLNICSTLELSIT